MALTWTLRGVEMPLANVAGHTGIQQGMLRRWWQLGFLGPSPAASAPARMPLLGVLGAIALRDAAKFRLSEERIVSHLPSLTAAALMKLATEEQAKGGWSFRGGADLSKHFWSDVRSSGADPSYVTELLRLGDLEPKSFAVFSERSTSAGNDLSALAETHVDWPAVVLSVSDIAQKVTKSIPGTLFTAERSAFAGAQA